MALSSFSKNNFPCQPLINVEHVEKSSPFKPAVTLKWVWMTYEVKGLKEPCLFVDVKLHTWC